MSSRSKARIVASVVFLAVFAFLFWLVSHRLTFANIDEGIYMDAGKRIAAGQAPYRDFFYLSGPGTPWAMGLSMRFLGANLPAARLMLIFDLSLMAMLVFWMTNRLSESIPAALFATLLFVVFSTMQPSVLVSNHRWDSASMGLAAIVLTWSSHDRPRIFTATLAGLACAAATWMTPSLGFFAITISIWFVLNRPLRPLALPFFCGAVGGLVAGAIVLQRESALSAMIDQFLWVAHNYSGANQMAYGQVIGGYGSLIHESTGIALIPVLLILIILTIPAWLPPLTTIGWLFRRPKTSMNARDRFEIPFLLVCGAVLIICQAPKLDLGHLMYPSAIYYTLAVALVAKPGMRRNLRIALTIAFLMAAGVAIRFTFSNRMREVPTITHAGIALMNSEESEWLLILEKYIKGGDSLFVFPYMPSFYYVLDARNPTRYSFLQPGMSSASDEARVLADLKHNPPQWIIHLILEPAAYLRIWPSSDRSRLRMLSIEQFIDDGYEDVAQAGPYKVKRYRR